MKRTFTLFTLFLLFFGLTGCCRFLFPSKSEKRNGRDVDLERECIEIGIGVSGGWTNQHQSTNYDTGNLDGSLMLIKSSASLGKISNTTSSQQQFAGETGESLLGYGVGLYTGAPVSQKLFIEGALYVTAKGSKSSSGTGNTAFEDQLNMTYVDVPLIARYKLGSKGLNVYGGIQPSYLLSAKRKTDIAGTVQTQKVNDQFKSVDFAAIMGVGYRFKNGIDINLGYDLGLSNINNDDFGGFKTKNRGIKLTLGYRFRGGK